MSDNPSFLELACGGYVLPAEIDDYVDGWHESDSTQELHEFLGMRWDEYTLWVAHPENINIIIAARLENRPVLEAVNDNLRSEYRLAARADDVGKLAILERWIAAQRDR
ncbi:hypothetical protein ACXY7D_06405 [Sphingomonas melonis]